MKQTKRIMITLLLAVQCFLVMPEASEEHYYSENLEYSFAMPEGYAFYGVDMENETFTGQEGGRIAVTLSKEAPVTEAMLDILGEYMLISLSSSFIEAGLIEEEDIINEGSFTTPENKRVWAACSFYAWGVHVREALTVGDPGNLYCLMFIGTSEDTEETVLKSFVTGNEAAIFADDSATGATGETSEPVRVEDGAIYIYSEEYKKWENAHPMESYFEFTDAIQLTEKEPTICLYDDGIKAREYTLECEEDDDFTGKYFQLSVRIAPYGTPSVPVAQISGNITSSAEDDGENASLLSDITYWTERYFLACGGETGKEYYEETIGRGLVSKGLKNSGYTTVGTIRLVGVCSSCNRSFCFHAYSVYMGQGDVAYSDDGLDCCVFYDRSGDLNSWEYTTEGKTFRYYNSFCCPHCGTPYIDYAKYQEDKEYGEPACVLSGREIVWKEN